MGQSTGTAADGMQVLPLADEHLAEAAKIFRVAFGTFLGAPEPERFRADRDYVYGRARSPHVAAFAAVVQGRLVGSNFATNWGSVGFFGPLTVLPELQDRGVGRALVARAVEQFAQWQTRQAGLFTFPHSPKHVGLYSRFGFYPRFLTAIMAAPANPQASATGWHRFGALPSDARAAALSACRAITEAIYAGLDLSGEIAAVQQQELGETILIEDAGGMAGFAVCHTGPRSEAGPGCCYIKFAAVRPGPAAERDFTQLLDACMAWAHGVAATTVHAGVNLAREPAYRALLARGFRTLVQGIAMHRDNDPGYCRPGVYVIDDWR